MPPWNDYLSSRQRRVELPGGYSVLLRQPDLRRVLATTPLEPRLLSCYALQRAAGTTDSLALSEAQYSDYFDLTCTVLCECCVEPQLFLDEADARAQGGVWIRDLAPSDIALLEQAAWGLLQLEVSDAAALAPFREPADAGAEGGAVADAAQRAATEFACATA